MRELSDEEVFAPKELSDADVFSSPSPKAQAKGFFDRVLDDSKGFIKGYADSERPLMSPLRLQDGLTAVAQAQRQAKGNPSVLDNVPPVQGYDEASLIALSNLPRLQAEQAARAPAGGRVMAPRTDTITPDGGTLDALGNLPGNLARSIGSTALKAMAIGPDVIPAIYPEDAASRLRAAAGRLDRGNNAANLAISDDPLLRTGTRLDGLVPSARDVSQGLPEAGKQLALAALFGGRAIVADSGVRGYDQARNDGLSIGMSALAGGAKALTDGVPEAISAKFAISALNKVPLRTLMSGDAKAVTQALQQSGKAMGLEFSSEQLSAFGNYYADRVFADPTATPERLKQDMVDAFKGTLIQGPAMIAGGKLMQSGLSGAQMAAGTVQNLLRPEPASPGPQDYQAAVDRVFGRQDNPVAPPAPPPAPATPPAVEPSQVRQVQDTLARILGEPIAAPAAPAPAPAVAPKAELTDEQVFADPVEPVATAPESRSQIIERELAQMEESQAQSRAALTEQQARLGAQPNEWDAVRLDTDAFLADQQDQRIGQLKTERDELAASQAAEQRAAEVAAPAAQPAANLPAASTERYGVDSTPFSDGGKPFKTKLAASKAKKFQPTLRVVSVPGGYALADKTLAQLAAEAKAVKRIRGSSRGTTGAPMAAHEFIVSEGGLSRAMQSDLGIEGNVRVGNRWLYAASGKGLTIEQAAEKLMEAGYIDSDNHTASFDLIRRSIKTPQYTPEGWEEVGAKQQEAEYADYLTSLQEADDLDPEAQMLRAGVIEQDIEDSGFYEADPEVQEEAAAAVLMAENSFWDALEDPLDELMRRVVKSNQERNNEQATQPASAQSAEPRGAEDRDQDFAEQGQAPASQDGDTQEGLTSYTQAEVEQRLARLEQAEQERKKQQRQADDRAEADAMRDDFMLTGSDRATDVAEARGQNSLFDAPAQAEPDQAPQAKQPLPVPEDAFADILNDAANAESRYYREPERTVRSEDRAADEGTISKAEADKRIEQWRANARAQGKSGVNSGKVVLSLFDASGQWSKPWSEAGYEVIQFDIQNGQDINDFSAQYLIDELGLSDVHAILAAPPCTDFSSSGAQFWKAKDQDGRTEASIELVRQTLRTVELLRPTVWAMENPVGRIAKLTGLPKPTLSFQPSNFGDPYTKRTMLWGDFSAELPLAPVEATDGSKIAKLSSTDKYGRSLTPEGFAYAFFSANNAQDMGAAQTLSREFKGLQQSDIQAALDAGVSESVIRDAVQDSYYDQDLDAANEALLSLAASAPSFSSKDQGDIESSYPTRQAAERAAKAQGLGDGVQVTESANGFTIEPTQPKASIRDLQQDQSALRQLEAADPGLAGKLSLATEDVLRDVEIADPARSDSLRAAKRAADAVGRAAELAFGEKPVQVTGNLFYGVQHQGRTFIDIEAVAEGNQGNDVAALALFTIGHETGHALQKSSNAQDRADYQGLRKVILSYTKAGVVDSRRDKESRAAQRDVGQQYAEDEVVNDINGAMWLDAKFWSRLYELDQGSTMRRIAYKFMENAAKLAKAIKGSRLDADAILTDIDAVREVAANVWARKAQRTALFAGQPASAGDQAKAEAYKQANDILPYLSEGQLDVPVEVGPSFSLKLEGKYGNHPVLGIPVNANGTVTLYYPTTNAEARRIASERTLKAEPGESRVYLTNESSGPKVMSNPGFMNQKMQGANVMVQVDPALLQFDMDYDDGRKDFFIPIAEGNAFAQKMKMVKLFTLDAPRSKALSPDATIAKIGEGVTEGINAYVSATPAERRAMLKAARVVLKAEHNMTTLLSENGKLEKTRVGEYGLTYEGKSVASMGFGMASAQKINEKLSTCPQSAICESLCLGETSGQNLLYGGDGQYKSGPRMSQYLKTEALVLHPKETAIILHAEVESLRAWSNRGYDWVRDDQGKRVKVEREEFQPAVRLNVTSDFPPKVFQALIDANKDVQWYDYTKLDTKPIAPNHHLTYSSTGASQVVDGKKIANPHSNWDRMVRVLNRGDNVAMAFSDRNEIPKFILDDKTGQRFGVWSGDNYDARFLDPKREDGIGWVIGLTNKDRTGKPELAAEKNQGFFLDYNPERDGDTLVIKDQSSMKESPIKITRKTEAPAFSRKLDEEAQPSQAKAMGDDGSFDAADPSIVSDMSGLQQDGGMIGRLPEPVRANVLARLKALQRRLDDGRIDQAGYIEEVQALMRQIEERNQAKTDRSAVKGRERGPDWVTERLIRAKRKGELDAETVEFALWALSKNPAIATDLAISLPMQGSGGTAGDYNPASRVMRLFKSTSNTTTAVHEILHHTERMMPANIQAGIAKAYRRAFAKAYEKADDELRGLLREMLKANAGDKEAYKKVLEGFNSGKLNYDKHYPLYNASEFWAVNASDIMANRFDAEGSWIAQVKQWLNEMLERIKSILGMQSDAAVLRGLKAVLNGSGKRLSSNMLMGQDGVVRDIPREDQQDLDLNDPGREPMKARDLFSFDRDAGNRRIWTAGRKGYERGAEFAKTYLGALKLADTKPGAFRELMRKFQADNYNAQQRALEVAESGRDIPKELRSLLSDIIEKEVAVGDNTPEGLADLAASITGAFEQQAQQLIELGMLSDKRLVANYLPRVYRNPLIGKLQSKEQVLAWFTKARMKIRGDRLKSRGLVREVEPGRVKGLEKLGWKLSSMPDGSDIPQALRTAIEKGQPLPKGFNADQKVVVWRDFTKTEREEMGEVRDAFIRFAMGYVEMQKDLAVGRLFKSISEDASMASLFNPGGWVKVPKTEIPGSGGVLMYGKLSGMYVERQVADQLKRAIQDNSAVMQAYDKALSLWKEGKTVWNPVAHGNNIVSNIFMGHFAGLNMADPRVWRNAIREYRTKGPLFQEAVENGLLGTEFANTEIQNALMPELKEFMTEADVVASRMTKVGEFLKRYPGRPITWYRERMQQAYEFEDQIFKLMVYIDRRKAGATPGAAITDAEQYFFNYSDVPEGIRSVQRFWSPFFSYTYKAIPSILHTATTRPDRILLPMALLGGSNWLAYAILAADDDEEPTMGSTVSTGAAAALGGPLAGPGAFAATIQRAKKMEAAERKGLPEYMEGRTALGTQKVVRLPINSPDGNPYFFDMSRRIPLGDVFDVTNQMGGFPLLQPFMPAHPFLWNIPLAIFANKDGFTGRELVKESDDEWEKSKKWGGYLYRQMAPNAPFVPGSYSFDKVMQATAKGFDTDIMGYTGFNNQGDQVRPGVIALDVTGVAKVRESNTERNMQFKRLDIKKEMDEVKSNMIQLSRRLSNNAITQDAYDRERERQTQKMDRLREKISEAR